MRRGIAEVGSSAAGASAAWPPAGAGALVGGLADGFSFSQYGGGKYPVELLFSGDFTSPSSSCDSKKTDGIYRALATNGKDSCISDTSSMSFARTMAFADRGRKKKTAICTYNDERVLVVLRHGRRILCAVSLFLRVPYCTMWIASRFRGNNSSREPSLERSSSAVAGNGAKGKEGNDHRPVRQASRFPDSQEIWQLRFVGSCEQGRIPRQPSQDLSLIHI